MHIAHAPTAWADANRGDQQYGVRRIIIIIGGTHYIDRVFTSAT